jgi:di/tricarboxylate transporter
MSDMTISFCVLGAVVVLFVWNRIAVELVAIGAGLTLYATGVLTIDQVLAGFGDPTVIFIATLFVVSEGLDGTGVTAWAGQQLIARVGTSRTRLIVLMMLLVAGLTSLISVNGAVAALLPMVVVLAIRLSRSPSQLLMPLAFAAHAGSMLALTGTPVNVIVSDAAVEAGGNHFGYFEFALVGIPLLAGTIAIVVLFGQRLLPERSADQLPADLSQHARTLLDHYTVDESLLPDGLISRERGVAEVVIPPRSGAIGMRAFPGMVTSSGDLVILAIERKGEDQGPTGTVLAAGDTILLQGTWDALDQQIDSDPDVLVVDSPAAVRRQAVPMGRRAKRALVVLAAMVVLLATGAVPSVVAGLLAAGAMILLGVVSVERAYRSISWTTVILVGAMIPISNAMQQTGAAEKMAEELVRLVGDSGPYPLAIGLFVLSAVLGQMISNMATALIVIPIALSAALETGVSGRPLLMIVNIACAASFLTPVATPVNMMVMGPAGYKFTDYWKLGLPLLLWFFVVAIGLVPIFWQF